MSSDASSRYAVGATELNRNGRNISILVAIIVIVALIHFMGTSAYRTGTGMLLLTDLEAGQLTGSQLANLTDGQRADLFARLHPRALAYAGGMIATIIMLITTVIYSALRGLQVFRQGIVATGLTLVLLTTITGVAYAIPPTVLGQPIYNTSGIAVVSAIAVLILSTVIFGITWIIRKMIGTKLAA
ncbi:hypothetical protein [Rhizobium sp. Leaf311]|uniref:hypothetical protein n=1 Tax=Rhizobium sp. Leaf311 TaxID=1736332 RepID=UPI0012E39013|nr:hypothetical protein [Rhizobium sp. Leaf311]